MSERGAAFFGRWVTDNVMRGKVGADIVSVAELTSKLFADAKAAGISEEEIEEEIGSAYEAILAAIVGSEKNDEPEHREHRAAVRSPRRRHRRSSPAVRNISAP